MIVKALKELYIALGGSEQDIGRLHTIRQMINAIAVMLGGEGNAKRVSEAIRNIIPVVPTGGGDETIGALIDRSITSVTIPNSVTSIGSNAFQGCLALTSVTIPDSVTIIGNGAFSTCRALTSVTIPNSVTSIGSSAFVNSGLEALILEANTVVTIPAGMPGPLSGTPIGNKTGYIYVPDDLVDSYKEASVWSTYAAQIKSISELPTE